MPSIVLVKSVEPVVAACGLVPVSDILQVILLADTYRQYRETGRPPLLCHADAAGVAIESRKLFFQHGRGGKGEHEALTLAAEIIEGTAAPDFLKLPCVP